MAGTNLGISKTQGHNGGHTERRSISKFNLDLKQHQSSDDRRGTGKAREGVRRTRKARLRAAPMRKAAGVSMLLNGSISMELARTDASIATFLRACIPESRTR